ncbi:MAG TPA: LysR family transcriptional regulator [Rhizomicrobium sp.]|nr:LysR family transcriptional regulator [Rhizomicrobium sp.]
MTAPFDHTQKDLNRSRLDDPRVLSGPFWGELRVFLAVAKAKSFNKAAEELNMSQPTVSRHVRRLQDVVHSQLIIATQNGVRLTPRGRELAEMLLTLDNKLFEISQDLKGDTQKAEGEVRLSVTDGLAGLFVAPSLVGFSEAFPRIHLHIKSPTNLTTLRENQTDVMLGFIPTKQADIETRQLGFLHFITVATHPYIERYGLPTRKNLESHFFVDSEYYSSRGGVWDKWHATTARGVVAHNCDNSFAYAHLVRCGLGIGLLGSFTLSDSTAVPLDLGVYARVPIFVFAQKERLVARPVRLVYDWVSDVFSASNPWFSSELSLESLPVESLSDTASQLLELPANKRP